MNDQRFSALIVDDEPALRRLVSGALARFNIACDEAGDGNEAGGLVCRRKYDVVVTDLRMPKRHGHALAVELLSGGDDRPLIVVLTGVLEPRLGQDLIARGVDLVEHKPVDFRLFGGKVRALCEARAARGRPGEAGGAVSPERGASRRHTEPTAERVFPAQLESRLDALVRTLPVSPAAIDVVNLIQHESPNAEAVAKRIAQDPGLCVELLKVANTSYYNPAGQRVDDLNTAILRLGLRRIGEMALASATLQLLARSLLPWVDADVVWRRCLATAQALERLRPSAALGGDEEGLFLSALLLPMSRVLAGLALPEHYERLIHRCRETGVSLASLEGQVLSVPIESVIAGFLARAQLSPRLHKPLRSVGIPYAEIVHLTEPLRTKVECLRVAAAAGQIVVQRWAPWDEIHFPPPGVTQRLRIGDLAQYLAQVRDDLARLAPAESPADRGDPENPQAAGRSLPLETRYFRLAGEPEDWLAAVLESLGVRAIPVTREAAASSEPVLVNSLHTPDDRVMAFLEECQPNPARVLVVSDTGRPASTPRGSFLAMPCSFGCFVRQLAAVGLKLD